MLFHRWNMCRYVINDVSLNHINIEYKAKRVKWWKQESWKNGRGQLYRFKTNVILPLLLNDVDGEESNQDRYDWAIARLRFISRYKNRLRSYGNGTWLGSEGHGFKPQQEPTANLWPWILTKNWNKYSQPDYKVCIQWWTLQGVLFKNKLSVWIIRTKDQSILPRNTVCYLLI